MNMQMLAQKSWSYTLYERSGEKILSVVCGGVAIYEVNVCLMPEEVARVDGNETELSALAEAIRSNPSFYIDRHVKL